MLVARRDYIFGMFLKLTQLFIRVPIPPVVLKVFKEFLSLHADIIFPKSISDGRVSAVVSYMGNKPVGPNTDHIRAFTSLIAQKMAEG